MVFWWIVILDYCDTQANVRKYLLNKPESLHSILFHCLFEGVETGSTFLATKIQQTTRRLGIQLNKLEHLRVVKHLNKLVKVLLEK